MCTHALCVSMCLELSIWPMKSVERPVNSHPKLLVLVPNIHGIVILVVALQFSSWNSKGIMMCKLSLCG